MCLLAGMAWKLLLIILCLCKVSFAASGKRIPNFAGPYKLIFLRKVSNESTEFNSTGDLWSEVRVSHYRHGQTQYFWGRTYNRIEINDTLQARVHVSSWSNNQWKPNAFVMKFDHVCQDAQRIAPALMPLLFGQNQKCPIPPGDRLITNGTRYLDVPRVPIFPYGHWLFTVLVHRGSKIVGILTAEIETTPKL